MKFYSIISILALLIVAGCNSKPIKGFTGAAEQDTYTLYRNSPIDVTMKIHIATFNSTEGYDDKLYNYENCERALKAFQNDPTFSSSRLYCELGYNSE